MHGNGTLVVAQNPRDLWLKRARSLAVFDLDDQRLTPVNEIENVFQERDLFRAAGQP